MSHRIRHFGWMVSPYSAKTRSFLRYAGVDFDDVPPTAIDLFLRIRRAVGVPVMPTVELPDGRFLKDSSDIIDLFEARYPERSVTPKTPKQRLASGLLELFSDEWLPLSALHYRWSRPESASFAIDEFGRNAAPMLPAPLQRRIGRALSSRMRSYLPILGIDSATAPAIERMTEEVIALLEETLRETPYVLGHRPCLGDFSLYGPLYAHLYRDPGSTVLFRDAPSVVAWIERMQAPRPLGDFAPGDRVPAPIERLLALAFRDQWPYLVALERAIDAYVAAHPDARRVPRALGDTEVVVGGARSRRKLVTFAQYKRGRVHAAYAEVDPAERPAVDAWLRGLGGEALTHPLANPFVHVDNRIRLA